MSDKRPLILWSGGLDSTYLVWSNLVKRDVDVMYVSLANNNSKVDRELSARTALKKLFEGYQHKIINDFHIEVPPINGNLKGFILTQPYLWVQAYITTFDPDIHSHAELGYIKSDCFWHIAGKIPEVINSTCKTFRDDIETIDVRYPLEWKSKADILDKYQNHFGKKILEHVTWCEYEGEGTAATSDCSCGPCTTMRETKHLQGLKDSKVCLYDMVRKDGAIE